MIMRDDPSEFAENPKKTVARFFPVGFHGFEVDQLRIRLRSEDLSRLHGDHPKRCLSLGERNLHIQPALKGATFRKHLPHLGSSDRISENDTVDEMNCHTLSPIQMVKVDGYRSGPIVVA